MLLETHSDTVQINALFLEFKQRSVFQFNGAVFALTEAVLIHLSC